MTKNPKRFMYVTSRGRTVPAWASLLTEEQAREQCERAIKEGYKHALLLEVTEECLVPETPKHEWKKI